MLRLSLDLAVNLPPPPWTWRPLSCHLLLVPHLRVSQRLDLPATTKWPSSSLLPPPACHQLCISIGATPEERAARVQRAWEAGHWARATLEGRISKPRPTPKVANRPTTYIVLRAPGLAHPVRVSTAAEYFKILPRFSEESVSHAFPSLSEARVYCIAAGVDFPELQER